jgi:hypothetical protein
VRIPELTPLTLGFRTLGSAIAAADDDDDDDKLPATSAFFAPLPLRTGIGLCIFSTSFAVRVRGPILDQACRSALARGREKERGDGRVCRAGGEL